MEHEKKCEDCVHFKDLFIIFKARFIKYGGFCGNQSVKYKFAPKLCDKLQQKSNIIKKEREDVTKALIDIRKSLADIALIIKED